MGNSRGRKKRAAKRAARGPTGKPTGKPTRPKWAKGADWWMNPDYVPEEPPEIPDPLVLEDTGVDLPEEFFPWTGWYEKKFYDAFLKDGSIVECVWPNADRIRDPETSQEITGAVLSLRLAKRHAWEVYEDDNSGT